MSADCVESSHLYCGQSYVIGQKFKKRFMRIADIIRKDHECFLSLPSPFPETRCNQAKTIVVG
jgi:hypothetical protein